MRAIFFPTLCSECRQGIRFAPAQEAPGGYIWMCATEGCREQGKPYELPEFDPVPFVQAALLRPKMKLV